MRHLILTTAAAALLAGAAAAQDIAVIVENTDYRRLDDVDTGRRAIDLEAPLQRAGFEVLRLTNAGAERLQDRFADRRDDLEEADRLLVVLRGHVMSDTTTAWLLGTDAPTPDAFTVGRHGIPLTAFTPILSGKPGAALLAVIAEEDGGGAGAGLEPGYLPSPDIPQGVTVLSGTADGIVGLLADDVLGRGQSIGRAVAGRRGEVAAYGFVPTGEAFLGGGSGGGSGGGAGVVTAPAPSVVLPPAPSTAALAAEEADAWSRARTRGTEAAVTDYLDRYPQGRNAAAARDLLREIRRDPVEIAAQQEEDLGLSRDARREVQRNLSVLGFNTRGVDGIFGQGTRAAVRDWQRQQGVETTGYLTGNQIARLQETAATRQAELEEEARRRQEEVDRADAAFWRDSGRGESEAALRQYLSQYPDGLYSTLAETRLSEYEAQRTASAAEAEQASWRSARDADTEASYEDYLANYPAGEFVGSARARLDELRRDSGQAEAQAQAQASEAQVLGNPITRLLVERRLEQLGLETGTVDGNFDEETRRAIRRYQRARDLPVTGFVTQQTLVRMLAG